MGGRVFDFPDFINIVYVSEVGAVFGVVRGGTSVAGVLFGKD